MTYDRTQKPHAVIMCATEKEILNGAHAGVNNLLFAYGAGQVRGVEGAVQLKREG